VASASGVSAWTIGAITSSPGVRAVRRGRVGDLMRLDSQRFSKDSWFTAGIESYVEKMSSSPLIGA
jgi:hypothetical protein